jgi:DNA-binding NarL/FixJ family response regulator
MPGREPVSARVLLADDHPLVRRGLRAVIDAQPDMVVAAEAEDGEAALAIALEQAIDLAVLDVAMPRLTGLQAAAEIARLRPEVKVLLLSMYDSEQYLHEALKVGASGYVLKTEADRDLVTSCRAALRGGAFVCPQSMVALLQELLDEEHDWDGGPAEPLTPRELEVLKLIAEAFTSEQIAEALGISRRTVDHHRANILTKLRMRDRVELTRYAIRRGLVEP